MAARLITTAGTSSIVNVGHSSFHQTRLGTADANSVDNSYANITRPPDLMGLPNLGA